MPVLTSGEVDRIDRAARALGVDLGSRRPTEEDAWWLARDALNYALKMAQVSKSPKAKAEWTNTYVRCKALLSTGRN